MFLIFIKYINKILAINIVVWYNYLRDKYEIN